MTDRLWHAAFHREDNGFACRSAVGGHPRTTRGAVATPQLHLMVSNNVFHHIGMKIARGLFRKSEKPCLRRNRGAGFQPAAATGRLEACPTGPPPAPTNRGYLIVTFAPASSSFFLMASASACGMFSLIGLGAPSTTSLASLRPRLVSSRTTLMTPIFLVASPTPSRTTVNSVCSAFASAGAAPPPPPPAMTTPPAAGSMPYFSLR